MSSSLPKHGRTVEINEGKATDDTEPTAVDQPRAVPHQALRVRETLGPFWGRFGFRIRHSSLIIIVVIVSTSPGCQASITRQIAQPHRPEVGGSPPNSGVCVFSALPIGEDLVSPLCISFGGR